MDTDEFEPNSPESATAVAEAVKEGVPDRKCSNIWQASAYLSAIGIAVGCGFAFGDSMHELALVCVCDCIATLVIFAVGVYHDNVSIYDPYWSIAPFVINFYFFIQLWIIDKNEYKIFKDIYPFPRIFMVFIVVFIFEFRLTWNFYRRWQGFIEEDYRYITFRRQLYKSGTNGSLKTKDNNNIIEKISYWIVALFGFMIIPTLMTFAGCIPIYYAMPIDLLQSIGEQTRTPLRLLEDNLNDLFYFNILDIIGLLLCIAAIIIEGLADHQLWKYIDKKRNGNLDARYDDQDLLMSGLWKYSRNPNYFGELLFWTGLIMFALATIIGIERGNTPVYDVMVNFAGIISIFLLVVFYSIPAKEKRLMRSESRKDKYIEYKEKVSVLIPWKSKL